MTRLVQEGKGSMGITKGTVMDKVTNIFSSSHSEAATIMGNNSSEDKKASLVCPASIFSGHLTKQGRLGDPSRLKTTHLGALLITTS